MKQKKKRKMQVQKLFTKKGTKGEFNILMKDLMFFAYLLFPNVSNEPIMFRGIIVMGSTKHYEVLKIS